LAAMRLGCDGFRPERMIKKLASKYEKVRVCYEGPLPIDLVRDGRTRPVAGSIASRHPGP
jgi:hypothetical protein